MNSPALAGNELASYAAIVSVRFKSMLQYRAAAFAGIVTQIFWGSVKLMVLGAFYVNVISEPPMTFADVVVYVWLGQVLLALLPWNNDAEIEDMFRTGSVSYELLRPLDLYWFWFARTIAYRTAPTLLRLVPGLVFAMLVLPLIGLEEWALTLPPNWVQGFLFLCSLAITVLLSSAVTMLVNISMYWMIEARGMTIVMTGLVTVFSGMVIPLPLFPDWAQPFLDWQPFRGLCDVPFRIYSGNIAAMDAGGEILLQFVWVVVIVAFGRALLQRAQSKLVVQGG